MLKEKMQPLGIGLIIIAVVVVVAVAVFATYYITLRCHNKNVKKRTDVELEIRKPNERVPVQTSDGTITVTSPEQDERPETDEVDSGNNRASASSPVKSQPGQVSKPSDDTITERSPEQDERPETDEVDSGNNRASASSPVKSQPGQVSKTSVCDDLEMAETSFKGATNTDTDNSDYDGDSDHKEEDPLLDSNDQNEVLTKPPAAQMTVSLKDKKTVRPNADNGPKRPCIEYRILDESKGERSFCLQFELKKPGVHLVLSTRREELSPSKYEIYFDEGKIRTSTKGKEGESFPCGCGKFSMIMEGEELSLSILDVDEGWIPLHTWEEQVYLNQCCSIAVFNMKFLQVEKCRRLTEFENPTSRTLSLHPKRE